MWICVQSVLDWLLEPSQPVVSYLTVRDLLEGTKGNDSATKKGEIASQASMRGLYVDEPRVRGAFEWLVST